jgi:hypothetical protein
MSNDADSGSGGASEDCEASFGGGSGLKMALERLIMKRSVSGKPTTAT